MTTILVVRHNGKTAMAGDGQVTLEHSVVKHDALKIRRVGDGKVLVGFAGATADAFALLERFEDSLKNNQSNLKKASIDLAKSWRTDKVLRQLQAFLLVADKDCSLLLSGTGDVIEPEDGVLGIGSGGQYAVASARALKKHSTLGAKDIALESLKIAADICVFTNSKITVEEL